MDVLADDERLMPHLHLSAQHGDDLVLKQMKLLQNKIIPMLRLSLIHI